MGKKVRTISDVVKDIHKSYLNWKEIYENGCTDPSWEDGVNLNLIRCHCIYHRNELEKMCNVNVFMYPDEYYWPLPPEVPADYMAKKRTIPCKGVTLEASKREFDITW